MGYFEPWWKWSACDTRSKGLELLIGVFSTDSTPLGSFCHKGIYLGLHSSHCSMVGVDYSNSWCHRHCLGIGNCLGHNRRISVWAPLASLFINPVSEIRLSGFKPTVLIQMFLEIRLVAETPSAATRA